MPSEAPVTGGEKGRDGRRRMQIEEGFEPASEEMEEQAAEWAKQNVLFHFSFFVLSSFPSPLFSGGMGGERGGPL